MITSFVVVHPEPAARSSFERRFQSAAGFRFVAATFPGIPPVDCFVTAGNSFGIMTAGIDDAVVRHFGAAIMERVQSTIVDRFRGEQPVGTAFVLDTGDADIPCLVHAPTMRVPGSIVGTDKVYAATFAALVAAEQHRARPIGSIAFPALGTGYGQMSFDEAARQMAVAWEHFQQPPAAIGRNWDWVRARHRRLAFDGDAQVLSGT
jgi:O-acetyl-ADP-ribose deacetylase (regulator of RNase III)